MSEQHPTELASTFFMVGANAFCAVGEKRIGIDINKGDPSIITLCVGAFRITTDRENWARIFNEFARTFTSEVVEVKIPTQTFRFDFSDTTRNLKVVPE